MTTRIEELWASLRGKATSTQRRVDSSHPLDLYADFDPPDRPGLVLFSQARPPDAPMLEAIRIERRQREDGRWSLRILLEEPQLLPVFAELCRDIIEFTRTGVDPERAGGPVLSRIERWRNLMQARSAGLNRSELRGLIGELLVLEMHVLPAIGPDEAVMAWTGPLGTDQDFQLPNGHRIEVKALDRDADRVRINGLGQLDGRGDPLRLAVVRLEDTGRDAAGSITPTRLIARLRANFAEVPAALQGFDVLLQFAGWDDASDPGTVAVRLDRIDWHDIDASFPRLTAANVPNGVVEGSYVIVLPPIGVA